MTKNTVKEEGPDIENTYQNCPQCIRIFSQSMWVNKYHFGGTVWEWGSKGLMTHSHTLFFNLFSGIMKAGGMCTPSTLELEGGALSLSNESRRGWHRWLPVPSPQGLMLPGALWRWVETRTARWEWMWSRTRRHWLSLAQSVLLPGSVSRWRVTAKPVETIFLLFHQLKCLIHWMHFSLSCSQQFQITTQPVSDSGHQSCDSPTLACLLNSGSLKK